jgi:hypothetical protein
MSLGRDSPLTCMDWLISFLSADCGMWHLIVPGVVYDDMPGLVKLEKNMTRHRPRRFRDGDVGRG